MMNGRTNVTTAGGDDLQIPLDPCTSFAAIAGNAQVTLTWTDPKDKYATSEGEQAGDPDQLVSVWSHTTILRKTGSAPTGIHDGVIVAESQVRNQYQANGYVDTTAENLVTYYYAVFAYNGDSVPSEIVVAGPVMPIFADPTLNNNTWERINEVALLGNAPSIWEVGDTKRMAVKNMGFNANETGEIDLAIIAFNHNDLTDGSGKAPITFGALQQIETTGLSYGVSYYGKYIGSVFYNWIMNESTPYASSLFNMIPATDIISYIPEVSLYTDDVIVTYDRTYDDYRCQWSSASYTAKFFIPTLKEYGFTNAYYNDEASVYPGHGYDVYPYYTTLENRQKPYYIGSSQSGSPYIPVAGSIDFNAYGYMDDYNTYLHIRSADNSSTCRFGGSVMGRFPLHFCIGKNVS